MAQRHQQEYLMSKTGISIRAYAQHRQFCNGATILRANGPGNGGTMLLAKRGPYVSLVIDNRRH